MFKILNHLHSFTVFAKIDAKTQFWKNCTNTTEYFSNENINFNSFVSKWRHKRNKIVNNDVIIVMGRKYYYKFDYVILVQSLMTSQVNLDKFHDSNKLCRARGNFQQENVVSWRKIFDRKIGSSLATMKIIGYFKGISFIRSLFEIFCDELRRFSTTKDNVEEGCCCWVVDLNLHFQLLQIKTNLFTKIFFQVFDKYFTKK